MLCGSVCHIVQAEIRRIEEERLEKLRQEEAREEEARQEEARRAEEARPCELEPITSDVGVVAPEALANFSDAAQALIVEAMIFSPKCLKQLALARYGPMQKDGLCIPTSISCHCHQSCSVLA